MSNQTVWTIAGSDSSGDAGIQADLATFKNFGVHGASVITAITAQNAQQIIDIYEIPSQQIASQLSALQNALPAQAIKIGMLGNSKTINQILSVIKHVSTPIVLDPVLIATSGADLFSQDLSFYIKKLITLFPYIDLLTPNLAEMEAILGCSISSYADIEKAAAEFLALGVKNILIKGGHFTNDPWCQDYWSNGQNSCWFAHQRFAQKNYRGSGCILSAAIAANLALGYGMQDAIVRAKMYINRGIRLSQPYNSNVARLLHEKFIAEEIDLPCATQQPLKQSVASFPDCGPEPLGLYPIVNSSEWLKKLLPLGVKTIQLRIKDMQGTALENEIKESVQLANDYQARLFINDYWELAIAHGAYGVHLGQEDLSQANIERLLAAGLRLGISTHCYYEVARAHALKPSYIACGPIFPTTSKMMAFAPQGITQLKHWKHVLKNYRLVAVGGIQLNNIDEVASCGIDGIAMISAITQALHPEHITQTLLHRMEINQCLYA